MKHAWRATRRGRAVAVIVVAALGSLFVGEGVLCGELPRTNLSTLQLLARDLGKKLGESLQAEDSSSLDIVLRPSDQAWILQGPFTEGLSTTGRKPVIRDGDLSAECTISAMSVTYENSRRESMFGDRIVDRVVNLQLRALVSERRSGRILCNTEYATTSRDTVEVSAIPRLEDATIPETKGQLPQEGFFSTFAEPLIMIGAVAVSVLLLFHVRS